MTDKEKAIIMAYTGICMLAGDKFRIFHKYVEDIMGRPVYTHEIGLLADAIKEKAEADFMALCADESSSENPNKWIPIKTRPMTEEEQWYYASHYSERQGIEVGEILDCKLPYDGQEVCISYGNCVGTDIFCQDVDGCYFEVIDINDVDAWMPLPEPYKKEESEGVE